MIPEHTKFICNSFFELIKKVYQKNQINTINNIKDIINNLSKNNEAIISKFFGMQICAGLNNYFPMQILGHGAKL